MTIFEDKDEELVRKFLFNKIQKECDADPEIMTDYILVTLRNDMSNEALKEHCKTDLSEFFGEQTNSFVDSMFLALDRKAYLPSQSASSSRAERSNDDSRGHGSSLGDRRRSRSPSPSRSDKYRQQERRRRDSRSPSRERQPIRSRSSEFNQAILDGPLEPNRQAQIQLQQQQQQQQQQVQLMQQMQPQGIQIKRKKPCYEFIRKGKCQRGNSCNFEHVTLEQAQMMGLQLPQNLLNLQQAQQQQQQQGMMRPPMGVNGQFMMAPQQRPQGQMPGMMAPQAGGFFRPQMMQPQQQHRQFGGNVRPHHMANASNGHDASGQPPQQLSATAVFVTNIPDDHLSEQHVTEFFGKFGEIQNIRIDYNKHNAIVDFKDSNAQQQAISTPEAIFNNRFVRIHKAREQAAASANANTNDTDSTRPPVAAATPAWRPKSAAIKKAELIEKYVEQQKELMKKITTTKNMPPATRKIIMQSIAEIQKKMDDINNKHKGAAAAAAPSAAAPSVSAASSVSQGTSGATDNTQAATESTEAENQQQEQPAAATAADAVQNEKLALQAKLKALEEEAQRLGMSTGAKPFQLGRGGSAAATRGRGGRGGWAGARGSMSLDKRSRTLVLKNVGQDAAERLDSEMAQFGEVEMMDKLEDNNEAPFTYAVKFKARWEAENAMKAIHSIASFESVSAEWDQ